VIADLVHSFILPASILPTGGIRGSQRAERSVRILMFGLESLLGPAEGHTNPGKREPYTCAGLGDWDGLGALVIFPAGPVFCRCLNHHYEIPPAYPQASRSPFAAADGGYRARSMEHSWRLGLAYEDLAHSRFPQPERLLHSLQSLRAADGASPTTQSLRFGLTTTLSAAILVTTSFRFFETTTRPSRIALRASPSRRAGSLGRSERLVRTSLHGGPRFTRLTAEHAPL